MPTKIITFNSFSEYLAAAEKTPDCETSLRSSRREGEGRWFGTDTFEGAVALAKTGWAEGAEQARSLRVAVDGVVNSLVSARSRSYSYDLAGEYVDVGLHLCGDPECFGVETDTPQLGDAVVKLVVNRAVSAAVSAEALIARGTAIAAAIDVLESLGRRVELWIGDGNQRHDDGHRLETYCKVKDASQPLDPDLVAYVVAHPASRRRLGFSIAEQHGFYPTETRPSDLKNVDDGIVTPCLLSGVGVSGRDLVKNIADICQQAGIEIPDEEIEELCKGVAA